MEKEGKAVYIENKGKKGEERKLLKTNWKTVKKKIYVVVFDLIQRTPPPPSKEKRPFLLASYTGETMVN